jgi:hypothetical protein
VPQTAPAGTGAFSADFRGPPHCSRADANNDSTRESTEASTTKVRPPMRATSMRPAAISPQVEVRPMPKSAAACFTATNRGRSETSPEIRSNRSVKVVVHLLCERRWAIFEGVDICFLSAICC